MYFLVIVINFLFSVFSAHREKVNRGWVPTNKDKENPFIFSFFWISFILLDNISYLAYLISFDSISLLTAMPRAGHWAPSGFPGSRQTAWSGLSAPPCLGGWPAATPEWSSPTTCSAPHGAPSPAEMVTTAFHVKVFS